MCRVVGIFLIWVTVFFSYLEVHRYWQTGNGQVLCQSLYLPFTPYHRILCLNK
jgi:hypothetical protein